MANTATLIQTIPCSFSSSGFSLVYQYLLVFDSLGVDLTVHDPAADARAAVVGIYYAEADAHNLIWKSASTTLVTLAMPADSGQFKGLGIGDGAIVIGKVGEDLIANNTTSLLPSVLVYVAEIGKMGLNFQST